MIDTGKVNAIVHSRPSSAGPLFTYGFSRSVAELRSAAKSHYYPSEISRVIAEIRATPGRYAFVGVPCVIKAVRSLILADPVLRERIAITVGLFCGHMKTAQFAEALGWEAGIHPSRLDAIDFRVKFPEQPASIYGYRASGTDLEGNAIAHTRPMRETQVYDWGIGWFRPQACDYCDDVVAECADISFGDAWLPEYVGDWRGTNVIVARNADSLAIIRKGGEDGELDLIPIGADRVVESQQSGFSHRREGLAYRLWLKQRKGAWTPPKRVEPGYRHLSFARRRILSLRMALSAASMEIFAEARRRDDYDYFPNGMRHLLRRYQFWLMSRRAKLRWLAFLAPRLIRNSLFGRPHRTDQARHPKPAPQIAAGRELTDG